MLAPTFYLVGFPDLILRVDTYRTIFLQRSNHLINDPKCAGYLGVDATSTADSNVTAGVEILCELMLL